MMQIPSDIGYITSHWNSYAYILVHIPPPAVPSFQVGVVWVANNAELQIVCWMIRLHGQFCNMIISGLNKTQDIV